MHSRRAGRCRTFVAAEALWRWVCCGRVSATIAHGSLVCLLGPSGCGKTTTLRLIAGFIDPDGSTIKVGDRVVSEPGRSVPPERRNMSMIFQSYALWPHMTIAENVGYGLKIRKVARAERDRRIAAKLAVARLTELAPCYPHELSGGQQQRAALARALVVEPETLLLDEPLSNLHANLREEMRSEIRRLHDEFKYTTVYVTHDQAEAMTTADSIMVMNKGRGEQIDSPADIYQRPSTEFVARFIGGTNILRAAKIGTDLVDCGAVMLRCGEGEFAPRGETACPCARTTSGYPRSTARRPSARRATPKAGSSGRPIWARIATYLVALEDGQSVRVIAPLAVDVPVGERVRLKFSAGKLPRAGAVKMSGKEVPIRNCRPAIASLLFATPALAAPPAPSSVTPELIDAAKKDGTVVFYTSIELQTAEKIGEAFEKAYSGIHVQVERNGAERIFQRLMQERGASIHAADVVECSDMTALYAWKSPGRLAPFLAADVTKWPADPRDPDGTFATERFTLSPILYNTALVKPEDAPKSLADPLDPKWDSKIVKAHPGYSGTIMTVTFEIASDIGWDFFKKLGPRHIMQVQLPIRRKRSRKASARWRPMAANTCRCR
jgi:iron(III) transport system ATP-binding protein